MLTLDNFLLFQYVDNIWKNGNTETLKSTVKHWKHWIKFNVEILNNIHIALSFNVHFFYIKNIESKSMSMLVQTLSIYYKVSYLMCLLKLIFTSVGFGRKQNLICWRSWFPSTTQSTTPPLESTEGLRWGETEAEEEDRKPGWEQFNEIDGNCTLNYDWYFIRKKKEKSS